jgi:hypothetical protein
VSTSVEPNRSPHWALYDGLDLDRAAARLRCVRRNSHYSVDSLNSRPYRHLGRRSQRFADPARARTHTAHSPRRHLPKELAPRPSAPPRRAKDPPKKRQQAPCPSPKMAAHATSYPPHPIPQHKAATAGRGLCFPPVKSPPLTPRPASRDHRSRLYKIRTWPQSYMYICTKSATISVANLRTRSSKTYRH